MKKRIQAVNLLLTEAILNQNKEQEIYLRNKLSDLISMYKKELVK